MSIKTDVAVIKSKVEEMHKELMGNGQNGLVKEFARFKGGFKFMKFIIAVGMPLLTALVLWALKK